MMSLEGWVGPFVAEGIVETLLEKYREFIRYCNNNQGVAASALILAAFAGQPYNEHFNVQTTNGLYWSFIGEIPLETGGKIAILFPDQKLVATPIEFYAHPPAGEREIGEIAQRLFDAVIEVLQQLPPRSEEDPEEYFF